ncbi:MAG: LysR substrate-binding domain-containing protein [Gammaproteobacteria bacterium]
MNIRNIDLNLLHIFVIVYECRSITRAAAQLHLSQPAVSNAITRLNNTLKLTLFVKNSRNINPTLQADKLYKDIKSCLQKIESSLSQQIHFDPATSERTFRVATTNYGELALFPKLIPYLQKHAPNIRIVREFFPKSGFSKHLQTGKLDLALFLDRPVEKEIRKEFIINDTLVLITGPQHRPLPDNLALDDVVDLDIIGFGSEYDEYDPLMNMLKQHPGYRPPRFTLATMWSAFYMVSGSNLVAVAPSLLTRILEKQMQLRVHRLKDIPNTINLNLYWRDTDTKDPAHIWFRNLIKSIFTQDADASAQPHHPEANQPPSSFDSYLSCALTDVNSESMPFAI